MYFIDYSASLSHHGVKGMKWGVRRAEKYKKKQVAHAGRSAAKNLETSQNLHKVGSDLAKYGSKSRWAGFIGDYNDTYGPGSGDNAAAKYWGRRYMESAPVYAKRAQAISSLQKSIASLDSSKMTKKDIKNYVNKGYARINKMYDAEDFGVEYTVLDHDRYYNK